MPTISTLNMFVPITKVDAVQRLVYGTLASETVDKTGEVFDYESSKPLVEAWSGEISKATDGKSVGNLRAMHNKVAAGKFTTLECNDQTKSIEVCAKVVDNDEWEKVAEGVYTGFSIGGSYEKKWTDDAGLKRYTARPSEGSLVDNPANPDAHFTMVKANGVAEEHKFKPAPVVEPSAVAPELEQVWKTADGKTFATKAEAKAHLDSIAKGKTDGTALTAALADLASVAKAAIPPAAPEVAPTPDAKVTEKAGAMPDGRYAIANKDDMAAAIKSFGKAKGKKAVKAHIMARAAALKAEDALPPAWKPGAEKSVRFDELRKGLSTVARLACLIQELDWLQESAEYEESAESDDSKVPDTLKQNIAALGATLRAMVEEETNELLDEDEAIEFGEMLEMSARTSGIDALEKVLGGKAPKVLTKVGMRHGKADQENLNKAHDCLKAMGIGKCAGMGKSAGDDLGKAGARHSKADAEHLQTAHDSLCKAGANCAVDDAGTDAKDDSKSYAKEPKEPKKAAPADDLTKALQDERAKTGSLEKVIADAVVEVQGLKKSFEERIARLEAQPMPDPRQLAGGVPGNYRIVEKVDDVQQARERLDDLKKNDPDEYRRLMFLLARSNPLTVSR